MSIQNFECVNIFSDSVENEGLESLWKCGTHFVKCSLQLSALL